MLRVGEMTLDEHRALALRTVHFDGDSWVEYLPRAMGAEAWEVIGVAAKHARDCKAPAATVAQCSRCMPKLVEEIGDFAWMANVLAHFVGPIEPRRSSTTERQWPALEWELASQAFRLVHWPSEHDHEARSGLELAGDLARFVGVPLGEILSENIIKLECRFPYAAPDGSRHRTQEGAAAHVDRAGISYRAAEPCDCDLRDRQWNPNTGKCGTCRRAFRDLREGKRGQGG